MSILEDMVVEFVSSALSYWGSGDILEEEGAVQLGRACWDLDS
jgi:hypothetical protein